MADKEDTKQEKQKEDQKAEKSEKKSLISRLLPVIIILIVVGLCASAGFGLGRLLGGTDSPETPESISETDESDQTDAIQTDKNSGDSSEEVWYYDLEPVVANLNEPSITRYVSATLTFEMSSSLDKKKGTEYLDEKKPIIINWLTIYLSGLGLDDIRGDKNLMSIKSHIRDALNEKLFPDSKPQIKDVLIQKFPVQ